MAAKRMRSLDGAGNGSRRRSRAGTATVEMAIAIPVLMSLVVGLVETCNMIFLQQTLELSSYEAGRLAIRNDTSITVSDVHAAADRILVERNVVSPTVTVSTADLSLVNPGEQVVVTVAAAAGDNSIFPPWFWGGYTLTATTTMVKE